MIMKKILFIHQHYYPEMAGTARRTKELAETLAIRGYNCSVLTSFPREYRSVPSNKVMPYEKLNNVNIHRINTYIYVKKNVFTRLLSYSLYFIFVLQWLYKHRRKFDLVISIAPLSSGIAGAFAQKFLKIPHHFDVPDILPDLGIAAGMIKNKYMIKILFKIEKWVYDNSTTISAITQGQIKNIENKKVSPNKLYLIPDWVDVKFFKENINKYNDVVRKKINPHSNYKIISFVGNIGALQGADNFIEVVKLLNRHSKWKFKFLFIGDGIMLPTLQKKVKDENIQNVEFVGRVPREYVPSFMNQSDVLVANYLDNSYMDICIPGKIYEYIISNKPIVIGAKGETAKLVKKFNAGEAVGPSNPKGIKNCIDTILQSPGKYKYSTAKFEKIYQLGSIIDKYIKLIEKIYK